MRKPTKAKQMINYLEEKMLSGVYTAGSRIPSVRRLSGKFGIAYSTALRGIDYLCRQGVLEKSPKRGIYVKNTPVTEIFGHNTSLAVLIAPYIAEMNAGLYYSALNGMQKLAVQKQCILKIIPIPRQTAETTESLQELCRDCQGVILLHEFDYELKASAVNLPAVGIMMHNNFKGKISVIDLDPFNAAEAATEYFSSRNIRNVVIVSCYHSSCQLRSTYVNRGRIFQQYWEDEGKKVKDFIISRPDFPLELDYHKNVGYYFTSDSLLQEHSLDYLEKNGRMLADDYKVLGIDGKSLLDPDFHKFPTLSLDWTLAGKMALHECLQKIKEPGYPAKRIYLNSILNINNANKI